MNRQDFQNRVQQRFAGLNIAQRELDRMYRQHVWEEEQAMMQMVLMNEAARGAQQYSAGGVGGGIASSSGVPETALQYLSETLEYTGEILTFTQN